MSSRPLLRQELSDRTAVFGLLVWVVIGICLGAAFVVVILLVSLWLACRRRPNAVSVLPVASEEIQEISVVEPSPQPLSVGARSLGETLQKPLPSSGPLSSAAAAIDQQGLLKAALEVGHRGGGEGLWSAVHPPEVSNLGWGNWYALRELQVATNMFADENVIGEGGCGIVYIGVLQDNTQVAVKNLLNNRGQAEREFKVEVEAIGRARHKNLVRLLGYCAEGDHRILVYEYVNNGNLDQWLHGDVGSFSPLTWGIRMNIILGTAKGMMYLHEGLEPKVVHRDIKSSNILIDKHWNAKVSDFGLAKLLGPERSYVTTRVMGTFGYVAPEYATTGMLNERSDVYSFGVLIMEIISGRNPIDYSRPPGEVNLVEWIKIMVSNHNSEGVLDPKLCEKPLSRALKRALLVALRCIDADSQKRPRMGQVIHMLEVADFPYRDEQRAVQTNKDVFVEKAKLLEMVKSQDSTSRESNTNVKKPLRWKRQDN